MVSALVCLILAVVAVGDLRNFRISNVAVLLLAGCFLLEWATASRPPPLLPHLGFAAAGLTIGVAGYARGWLGGGDAKLLTAALLWVGPAKALAFVIALSLATIIYGLGASLERLPARDRAGRKVIPFGPSIAVAWIAAIVLG